MAESDETERIRMAGVHDLVGRGMDWIGVALSITLAGAFGDSIAHSLAGKNTHVTITLAVTVGVALSGVAAVAAVLMRSRGMRKRNGYLRRRVKTLEDENEDLRRQIDLNPPLSNPRSGP